MSRLATEEMKKRKEMDKDLRKQNYLKKEKTDIKLVWMIQKKKLMNDKTRKMIFIYRTYSTYDVKCPLRR